MMNAKDFYETYIRGLKVVKDEFAFDSQTTESFSSIVYGTKRTKDIKKQIDEFLPSVQNQDYQFSTDNYLNELMKEIITACPEEIQQELETIYVVKRINYEPNAYAHYKGNYKGFIIEYWIGLTILIECMAVMFKDYHLLQNYYYENIHGIKKYQDTFLEGKSELIGKNLHEVVELIRGWRIAKELKFVNPVNFEPFLKEPEHYLNLINYTAMYALSHEIGHHILNHTKSGNLYHLITSKLPSFDYISNESHRNEFMADCFALKMLSFIDADDNSFHLDLISAPYLCMISLATLISPTQDSSSHPSIQSRCKNLFQYSQQVYGEADGLHRFVSSNLMRNFVYSIFTSLDGEDSFVHWWDFIK